MNRPRRDGEGQVPIERQETVRQALARALRNGTWTIHELSVELRVGEREIAPHLEHLAKSLARQHEALQISPASCLECGFSFQGRRRAGRPSRCPKCKSERLSPARYAIVSGLR